MKNLWLALAILCGIALVIVLGVDIWRKQWLLVLADLVGAILGAILASSLGQRSQNTPARRPSEREW